MLKKRSRLRSIAASVSCAFIALNSRQNPKRALPRGVTQGSYDAGDMLLRRSAAPRPAEMRQEPNNEPH